MNRIYPADQLMEETMKFAKKRGHAGFAIKMAKHAINFGYELPLDPANRLEMECCAQCFSTQDQKEGMKAFVENGESEFHRQVILTGTERRRVSQTRRSQENKKGIRRDS